MNKFIQIHLVIVIFVISISESAASVVCHDEQIYPAVQFNGLTEQQLLRIVLIGSYINLDTKRATILQQSKSEWIDAGEKDCHVLWKCSAVKKRCAVEIPKINMTVKEAGKYRKLSKHTEQIEQNVSACSQVGDEVYFGIEFYEGEGTNGVGGIGKFNIKSQELEIRRLSPLINTSVTNLVFDGEDLWVSASSFYECEGRVPTVPLLRYNWERDHIYTKTTEELRFCGFNVNDMYWHDNKLYIASDMGLSIGHRRQVDYGEGLIYEWEPFRHYVLDRNSLEKMVWVTCKDVYEDLLSKSPTKNNRDFIELLIKYKSEYVVDKLIRLINGVTTTGQ